MLETKRAKDATAIAQKILALVVNQCILPEVIEGNRFLSSRAEVQGRFLEQIEARFENLTRVRLPLLDRDLSELDILRTVGTCCTIVRRPFTTGSSLRTAQPST